jgi:hypothetical protein
MIGQRTIVSALSEERREEAASPRRPEKKGLRQPISIPRRKINVPLFILFS